MSIIDADAHVIESEHTWDYLTEAEAKFRPVCCSKVNLSGSNGNVNMSGWKDDNPDDERRETTRHHTTIVT